MVAVVEPALRADRLVRRPEIGVGVVGLSVAVAPVFELRADAVPRGDLDDRPGAGPEAAGAALHLRMGVERLVSRIVERLLVGDRSVAPERSPRRGVEVRAGRVDVDVGRGIVAVGDARLRRVVRHRAVDAVLAAFFERDADHAARRVGVVGGARHGHDLDFPNLLGPERPQVGQQLFGLHAQLPVVDVDFRAAFAVDRDFFAVDPDAGRPFEQFDAVLADGRRGVGHIDHEAVRLAPHQLSLHHHALDAGGRGPHHEYAQIVVRLHAHRFRHGVEPEELNLQRVVARCGLQFEPSPGVGRPARHLLCAFQQHDRRIFDGVALFVHHAPRRRAETGRGESACDRSQNDDEEDCSFHNILFCILFVCAKIYNNIYTMQNIVLKFSEFFFDAEVLPASEPDFRASAVRRVRPYKIGIVENLLKSPPAAG